MTHRFALTMSVDGERTRMPPLGLRGRGDAMGSDVVEVAAVESIANWNGRWIFRWVKPGCGETRRVPMDSCGGRGRSVRWVDDGSNDDEGVGDGEDGGKKRRL